MRRTAIKPTLQDVATAAGVSVATVSRVLSGSPRRVDPALAAAVRRHADALGYRVHPIARALRRQQTGQIGVVIPSLRNAYFVGLVEELTTQASEREQSIMLMDSQNSVAKEAVHLTALADSMVDGIIVVPVTLRESAPAVLATLSRCATVQVDRYVQDVPCSYVGADNTAGVRLLADHLRAGGRQITYIGTEPHNSSADERLVAFRAVARTGDDTLLLPDFTVNAGRDAAERLLAQRGREGLTNRALLASADVLALGLTSALTRLGCAIPGQVTVASFDGTDLVELVEPPITSLAPPLDEIARDALRLLGEPDAPKSIRHPMALRRRSSTTTDLSVRASTYQTGQGH